MEFLGKREYLSFEIANDGTTDISTSKERFKKYTKDEKGKYCVLPDGSFHGKFSFTSPFIKIYGTDTIKKKGTFVDGKRHGEYKKWLNSVLVTFRNYSYGKKHGKEIKWYAFKCKEKRAKFSKKTFEYGEEKGDSKKWHTNGNLKYHKKISELETVTETWFISGSKQSKTILHSDGRRDVFCWYDVGFSDSLKNSLKEESHFKNGKLDGEAFSWYQFDKILAEKCVIEDGVVKSYISWYRNGSKRYKYFLLDNPDEIDSFYQGFKHDDKISWHEFCKLGKRGILDTIMNFF